MSEIFHFIYFSPHDVSVGDMSMSLSTSDIEYLQENLNSVDVNQVQAETTQLTDISQPDDSSVSTLTSGNTLVSNPILTPPVGTLEQSHFVQSGHVLEVKPTDASNLPVVSVNNDSGFASSPINGSLSSALKGLNLVSNESSIIPGPFQIIGHTGTLDANVLTDLQILDTNGQPIQVPVQIVSTNNNECAIHLLSVQVDSDKSDNLNNIQEYHHNIVKVSTSEDVTAMPFDQPCQTSTPAVHMDRLDETILAGNIMTPTVVHGPTPDKLPEISPDVKTTKQKQGVTTECTQTEETEKDKKKVVLKKKENEYQVNKKSANALNYMGTNKKPAINIVKEDSDNTENHLEPTEKVHNKTYCRKWVSKATNPMAEAQDDSAFLSSFSSLSSTKSESDFLGISSVSKRIPEVKSKRPSVLESIDSDNVPLKQSSQGMYVMFSS